MCRRRVSSRFDVLVVPVDIPKIFETTYYGLFSLIFVHTKIGFLTTTYNEIRIWKKHN